MPVPMYGVPGTDIDAQDNEGGGRTALMRARRVSVRALLGG